MKKNVSSSRRGLTSFMLAATLSASLLVSSAMAMEVPVSSTAAEINGQQVLTQVFEIDLEKVGKDFDPSQLIEDDFIRGEYVYSFDKITKEESETTEVKDVEQEKSIPSDTSDLQDNIDLFAGSIQYEDKDGYTGTLTLDTSSISTTTDGYTTTSSQITDTKEYTGLEYNDPTLIPETVQKNGYTLNRTSLDFNEETYLENSGVPATYSAVATYSRTLYSDVPTGYTVTAKYRGEVSKTEQGPVEYTVTYVGTAIPEEISVTNAGFFGNMDNTQAILITVFSVLGLGLLIALVFMLIKKFGKKGGKAPMVNGTDLSDKN